MTTAAEYPESLIQQALRAAQQGLALVCANLPYLAGLAHTVRLHVDGRVQTAGIFESGRLLINPEWFLELNSTDRAFVLAHELMHLTLRTHQRGRSRVFNIAHDFIINDMLAKELHCGIPAGGLAWEGASEKSAEELADLIERGKAQGRTIPCLTPPTSLGDALAQVGLTEKPAEIEENPADVLDAPSSACGFPWRSTRFTTNRPSC